MVAAAWNILGYLVNYVCRVRYVEEDDDGTVYSNDSPTMVDLTNEDNPINQKGYKYTAPSE